MKHLLVGARGIVGSAIKARLLKIGADAVCTTRSAEDGSMRFDLLIDSPAILPDADIVYLVAGIPNFLACETDRASYRVNVDAVIAIARRFPGAFLVYVSSDAVEWCGATALARQKSAVEACLLHREAAILRPARVTRENAAAFAELAVGIGAARMAGVYRWSN